MVICISHFLKCGRKFSKLKASADSGRCEQLYGHRMPWRAETEQGAERGGCNPALTAKSEILLEAVWARREVIYITPLPRRSTFFIPHKVNLQPRGIPECR